MSLYDAAKDALKVAQKADNIELIQKLLDVQEQALEMQDKQQKLQLHVSELTKENSVLKEKGLLEFDGMHQWLVGPDNPDRKFCPVCFNRDNFKSVLKMGNWGITEEYGGHCTTCNKVYH